jgi:hypothetical protein
VIENPDGIYDFINNEIRREWEEDARSEGRDPSQDSWLDSLSRRKWTLEIRQIGKVKPDPQVMNYADVKQGYCFQESLVKRSRELRETVERFAAVIWPVIVRKEDGVLMDGYCRYATLKALNASRIYTYVGALC